MDLFCEGPKMDRNFIASLEWKLGKWFDLQLDDIPVVLDKMEINFKDATVEPCEDCSDHVSFILHVDGRDCIVELFRGNMIDPYPCWIIREGSTERFFDVFKNINVEGKNI